jgi:hypothetical protein
VRGNVQSTLVIRKTFCSFTFLLEEGINLNGADFWLVLDHHELCQSTSKENVSAGIRNRTSQGRQYNPSPYLEIKKAIIYFNERRPNGESRECYPGTGRN